jgi:hypothetical protein
MGYFNREEISAAVLEERAACAKICMDRAYACEAKIADDANMDEDDIIELRSNAWQFSVLADEILAREDETLQSPKTSNFSDTLIGILLSIFIIGATVFCMPYIVEHTLKLADKYVPTGNYEVKK